MRAGRCVSPAVSHRHLHVYVAVAVLLALSRVVRVAVMSRDGAILLRTGSEV